MIVLAAAVALHVLCAGAAGDVVGRLAERYTALTGTVVTIVEGTAGRLRARMNAGEHADVVILPAAAIRELAQSGAVVGTPAALGRTGTAVGVRTGTPLPDLSSPAAFKAALLAAHAIASTDPAAGATGGIFFAHLLAQLGIADAVAPKLKLTPGGSSCTLVADGEADLCVQNVTEIVPVAGVTIAGPLPPALQNYITYTAAIPADAPSPDAARAFLGYLTAPEQRPAWQAAGFEH